MYRTIACETWDDPWFAELPPDAKLLFLYFITNRRATAAGVFEITARAVGFETGLSLPAIAAALTELRGKIAWYPDHSTVWVVNFYRHQRANSNEKFTASARKALLGFADPIQAAVIRTYPELANPDATPPSPSPNGISLVSLSDGICEAPVSDRDKEEETATEQQQEQGRAATEETQKPPRRPRQAAPKPAETEIPDDWPLDAALLAWWEKQDAPPGIDPARETEKWQDYHRLKRTKATDWAASWRNWMRKAIDFYQPPAVQQGRNGYAAPKRTSTEQQHGNLSDIFAARAARNGRSDPGERDRGFIADDPRLLPSPDPGRSHLASQTGRVG